jgi:hypothetical protein
MTDLRCGVATKDGKNLVVGSLFPTNRNIISHTQEIGFELLRRLERITIQEPEIK